MTKWVGFPNTAGTPDSPIGSWDNYENSLDRVYGREWEATEDGIITHMNIRWGANVNVGANGVFLVVYNKGQSSSNNGTKVGQSAINPAGNESTWEGDTPITVAGGETLDFVSGDFLVFGIAFDGAVGACGLSEDLGGAGVDFNQYSAVTIGVDGPPDSVSFTASGSSADLANILRYETISVPLLGSKKRITNHTNLRR